MGAGARHAQQQWYAHQRIEFMQVAQRGQRSIERIEVPRHLAAQHRDAHHQHDGPHARQLAKTVDTHGRDAHGDQHEEGLGG